MEGVFVMGLFTTVFLILDILCIIKAIKYFKLKKNGICCYAKVIRIDKEFVRTEYRYRPWFEYKTNSGCCIIVRCESSTSFKNAFPIGKKVKIYYDNDDPHKYIMDKNSLYVQIFLLFIVNIMLFGCGSLFIDLFIRTINYK